MPYHANPTETMFRWELQPIVDPHSDSLAASRCTLLFPDQSRQCGQCFRPDEDKPGTTMSRDHQGDCFILYKDPQWNRLLVDGIEVNHTNTSHDINRPAAGLLCLAIIGTAALLLCFTNKVFGYERYRRRPSHFAPGDKVPGAAVAKVDQTVAAAGDGAGASAEQMARATADLLSGRARRQEVSWHVFLARAFRALMPKPPPHPDIPSSCAPTCNHSQLNLVRVIGRTGRPGEKVGARDEGGAAAAAVAAEAEEDTARGEEEGIGDLVGGRPRAKDPGGKLADARATAGGKPLPLARRKERDRGLRREASRQARAREAGGRRGRGTALGQQKPEAGKGGLPLVDVFAPVDVYAPPVRPSELQESVPWGDGEMQRVVYV